MSSQPVKVLRGLSVNEVIERFDTLKSKSDPDLPYLAVDVFEYIPELRQDAWEVILDCFPKGRINVNLSRDNPALYVDWNPLIAIKNHPDKLNGDIPKLMQHPSWDHTDSFYLIENFPEYREKAWADLKGRIQANSVPRYEIINLIKVGSFISGKIWQILKAQQLIDDELAKIAIVCPPEIAAQAWEILTDRKPHVLLLNRVAESCPHLAEQAWTMIEEQSPDSKVVVETIANPLLRPMAWAYIQAHNPDRATLLSALEKAEKCGDNELSAQIWEVLKNRYCDDETMLSLMEKFPELRVEAWRVMSDLPLAQTQIFCLYKKYPELQQLVRKRLNYNYKMLIFLSQGLASLRRLVNSLILLGFAGIIAGFLVYSLLFFLALLNLLFETVQSLF